MHLARDRSSAGPPDPSVNGEIQPAPTTFHRPYPTASNHPIGPIPRWNSISRIPNGGSPRLSSEDPNFVLPFPPPPPPAKVLSPVILPTLVVAMEVVVVPRPSALQRSHLLVFETSAPLVPGSSVATRSPLMPPPHFTSQFLDGAEQILPLLLQSSDISACLHEVLLHFFRKTHLSNQLLIRTLPGSLWKPNLTVQCKTTLLLLPPPAPRTSGPCEGSPGIALPVLRHASSHDQTFSSLPSSTIITSP